LVQTAAWNLLLQLVQSNGFYWVLNKVKRYCFWLGVTSTVTCMETNT
jgi:hypothetical protein